ncbi:hypothetical protein QUC31_012140 [Theobroma cacao]
MDAPPQQQISYYDHVNKRHDDKGFLYACLFALCCCCCCHEACECCLENTCCCCP